MSQPVIDRRNNWEETFEKKSKAESSNPMYPDLLSLRHEFSGSLCSISIRAFVGLHIRPTEVATQSSATKVSYCGGITPSNGLVPADKTMPFPLNQCAQSNELVASSDLGARLGCVIKIPLKAGKRETQSCDQNVLSGKNGQKKQHAHHDIQKRGLGRP